MGFYKASKKKEDLKQSGGSAHIVKSGCYPVNIIAPFVNESKNGSLSVDLFLEHQDKKQVLYGNLRITNNDGSVNKIGDKVFNQLVVISGVDEVSDPVEVELPIGKDGKEETVAVLEDLADLDVYVHVQMEYSVYDENIQEKKIIRGFYRGEDKASAEEVANEEGFGEQFEKSAKYFENVTYKDGLDEEAIAKWIADNRPKGTGGSGASAKPAKPSFGKNKKFGRK